MHVGEKTETQQKHEYLPNHEENEKNEKKKSIFVISHAIVIAETM